MIDSLSLQKTSKRAANDLQLTGPLLPHCSFFHSFKILLDITSVTLDLFSCVTPARVATYPVNPPLPTGHGRTLINRQSSSGSYQNPHGGVVVVVVINTMPLRCWVTAKRLKMSLWIRSRPHTGTHTHTLHAGIHTYKCIYSHTHAQMHIYQTVVSVLLIFIILLDEVCVSVIVTLFSHGVPHLLTVNNLNSGKF